MRKFLRMMCMAQEGAGGAGGEGSQGSEGQNASQGNNENNTPSFDYDKLANIIAGKQTVTEDTVLKNYFKNQGLSKEEADQAMAAFKKQKAENTPDVSALQKELSTAQEAVMQAQIQQKATLQALELGLDAKTIPYVLKMADLSGVVGQDGTVNEETLKKALNKVLEDVPQLKPSATENNGFHVGGSGNNQQQQTSEDKLRNIFGLK